MNNDATTAQLKSLNDTVRDVVGAANGSLTMSARYQNGDVEMEFVIRQDDALRQPDAGDEH